jgi:DMSO/TMAO reductase YedYZ molybdopterin-dependent catalytic subunit
MEDLRQWPAETFTAKDHDGNDHTFQGVRLVRLLEAAGVTLGAQLRGKNLSKYVLATAADGYQVVFSLPELDAEFADAGIFLVYSTDGHPLSSDTGPFRIVVPDDKKHARWIRQIVSIEVLFTKD